MVNYIRDLLYEHDCVVIPGLGAFVGNERSASADKYQKNFAPPFKKLTFNSLLKEDDGILAMAMVKGEEMKYKTALNTINFFVEKFQEELNNKKSFSFDGIGRLYLNNDSKLIFIAEHGKNFSADSYGLKNVQFEPVTEKAEALTIEEPKSKIIEEAAIIEETTVTEPVYTKTKEPELKKESEPVIEEAETLVLAIDSPVAHHNIDWHWLKIAAVLLVIITCANMIMLDMVPSSLKLNQFSIMDLGIGKWLAEETPTTDLRHMDIEGSALTEDNNIGFDKSTETVQTVVDYNSTRPWDNFIGKVSFMYNPDSKEGFYVIIGSFSKQRHAIKAVKKYNNNYEAAMLPNSNGNIRVGLYLPVAEKELVESQLKQIKDNVNPSAWLIFNRHKEM